MTDDIETPAADFAPAPAPQADPADVIAEQAAAALADPPQSEAHRILTRIEDEVANLEHIPSKLIQWVKDMVAEAKAHL